MNNTGKGHQQSGKYKNEAGWKNRYSKTGNCWVILRSSI